MLCQFEIAQSQPGSSQDSGRTDLREIWFKTESRQRVRNFPLLHDLEETMASEKSSADCQRCPIANSLTRDLTMVVESIKGLALR